MTFRKLLIRITFRFLKRRNKLFAPIVFFGWAISFLRWLSKRAKKSCIELSVIPLKISFVEAVLKIAAKIELNPYKIVEKATKSMIFDV